MSVSLVRYHDRRRPTSLLSHARRVRLRRRETPPIPAGVELPSREAQRHEELERDLQLARDIQQGLLLEAVPHLRGWELSAISLPARDLGGDLYDFLALENGMQGIMIGDVSGKGLPAALRMAVARTVFRHEARNCLPPARSLSRINYSVLREIPHGMVTMLYLQLNAAQGSLVFANAGHNYPLLLGEQVEELEVSGLPLGVDLDVSYHEMRTQLLPGQTVLLYTDGVVEAENSSGEIFGFERLAALLDGYRHLKPRAIIATILQALRAFQGAAGATDDVTMVAVRRRLSLLGDELQSIAGDVLGSAEAQEIWATVPLPLPDAGVEAWAIAVADVVRAAQAQFGRGLSRELHGQLRAALDDERPRQSTI